MYPERKRNRFDLIPSKKYEKEQAGITDQLSQDAGLKALINSIQEMTITNRTDFFYSLSLIIVSYRYLSKSQYESVPTVGDTVKALKKLHGHLSRSLDIVTKELSQSVEGGLSGRLPNELASLMRTDQLSINKLPPSEHITHFAWLLSALKAASDSYLAYQEELMADFGTGRSGALSDSKMDGFIWNMIHFFIDFFPAIKIGSGKTNPFSQLCHYIAEEYLLYNKELTRQINSNLKLFRTSQYETNQK